jgi:hypothetical protein
MRPIVNMVLVGRQAAEQIGMAIGNSDDQVGGVVADHIQNGKRGSVTQNTGHGQTALDQFQLIRVFVDDRSRTMILGEFRRDKKPGFSSTANQVFYCPCPDSRLSISASVKVVTLNCAALDSFDPGSLPTSR